MIEETLPLLTLKSSRRRFATRSIVQRRLSIYNWNPGPRREEEDAFEQQIAGKWHVITLQEAFECVDPRASSRVTHYAGCAFVSNRRQIHVPP